jgi:hypothetical protein
MNSGSPHRTVLLALLLALLLAASLFTFHTFVLFVLASLSEGVAKTLHHLGGHWLEGNGLVLAAFLALFIAHCAEAAAWGLFLWKRQFVGTCGDGVYFAASSITSVGYGDFVLTGPKRFLGPIISINGLLMFGCSTAFLFLLIQGVWLRGS